MNEDAPTADAGDGTGMRGADSQQAPANTDAGAVAARAEHRPT